MADVAAKGAELQRIVTAAAQAAIAKAGALKCAEGPTGAQGIDQPKAVISSVIVEAAIEKWTTFKRNRGKAARAAVAPYCS